MEESLILVDEADQVVGYAPRGECHRGDGRRHRAIVLLLYDSLGHLLLQKRRAALWDSYWDLAGATHPRHTAAGDETYLAAAARCLATEWEIETPPALEAVFAFTYFARFGSSCENEHCVLVAGRCEGAIRPRPQYAYGLRWLDLDECQREMSAAGQQFTPWALDVLSRLWRHPLASTIRRG